MELQIETSQSVWKVKFEIKVKFEEERKEIMLEVV